VLVHPWDAPLDDEEWRSWLLRHDFGQLIAPGDGRDLPIVVPTHFLYDGSTSVRLHLAKPNPVWAALSERSRALLTVVDDYTYVPSAWQAAPGSFGIGAATTAIPPAAFPTCSSAARA